MKKVRSQTTQVAGLDLKTRICAATMLGFAVLLTSGCNKTDSNQTPGQKLDSAIAKTEQAAAEAKVQGEQSGAEIKAKTEAAFAKAGSALKNATENAESSSQVVANKTLNKIDDMAITTAISAELLKDAEIKLFRINVDTKDGAVTLKGSVPSDNVRERAAAIAKTFSGVQSVDNQLVVNSN